MKWVETNGRKPRTGDKQLRLRFRSGAESKYTYTADQFTWTHTGFDHDVIAVAISKERIGYGDA